MHDRLSRCNSLVSLIRGRNRIARRLITQRRRSVSRRGSRSFVTMIARDQSIPRFCSERNHSSFATGMAIGDGLLACFSLSRPILQPTTGCPLWLALPRNPSIRDLPVNKTRFFLFGVNLNIIVFFFLLNTEKKLWRKILHCSTLNLFRN